MDISYRMSILIDPELKVSNSGSTRISFKSHEEETLVIVLINPAILRIHLELYNNLELSEHDKQATAFAVQTSTLLQSVQIKLKDQDMGHLTVKGLEWFYSGLRNLDSSSALNDEWCDENTYLNHLSPKKKKKTLPQPLIDGYIAKIHADVPRYSVGLCREK